VNSPDTTKQAKAVDQRRRAMRESAEQVGGIGSWEWEPPDGEVLWSDNLFRIFGLVPGEIEPTPEYVFEHTHPDDRDQVADRSERAARGEELEQPFDFRIVCPDGSIRHLHSIIAYAGTDPPTTTTMVGFVHDVTEQRRAEGVIAAHVGVSEALSEWGRFEPSAERLLGKLGGAMDFIAGTLWLPGEDVLTPGASWNAYPKAVEFEELSRSVGIPRGAGLAGLAWKWKQPVHANSALDDPSQPLSNAAERAGLRPVVAIPALHDEEVLAVLEFHAIERSELGEPVKRSLLGIGYELGTFLSRRRGELAKPVLTPRELEVLQLAAFGESTKQIAELLVLSPATVKTHFGNIYARLGVADRAAAVAKAVRLGLVE
jgi:PAS domain S-box-containing protein